MRFYGITLLASAAVLGACGGEPQSSTDSAAMTAGATTTTTTPAATTPAAAGGAAGAVASAPATGTTHEVKMLGDEKGYRFEPANITIKAGDAVKWVMVSGAPHNVAWLNLASPAKAQINANMPGQKMGEDMSPMLLQPNENYTISFANVPAGKYDYQCTPHAAMNMKGVVTVQ